MSDSLNEQTLRAENPETGEEGFPMPPGMAAGWGRRPIPIESDVEPVDGPTEASEAKPGLLSSAEYAARAAEEVWRSNEVILDRDLCGYALAEAQVWATLAVAAATLEASPVRSRPWEGGPR